MPLQFLRPVECFQLEIEVDRLHFLDRTDSFRGVNRQSVDPPGDRDVPVVDRGAVDNMHLRAVVRILSHPLLGAPGVDVLANPHPAESVATLHADAAVRGFIDEVAYRTDDRLRVEVDAHLSMVNDRKAAWRFSEAPAASRPPASFRRTPLPACLRNE